MRNHLAPYERLIADFIRGAISAERFDADYIERFEDDDAELTEEEHEILYGLYVDVDAYCPGESMRGPDDLDETELRSSAEMALEKLRALRS